MASYSWQPTGYQIPASGAVGSYGAKSLAELRAMIRRRADMPLGDTIVPPVDPGVVVPTELISIDGVSGGETITTYLDKNLHLSAPDIDASIGVMFGYSPVAPAAGTKVRIECVAGDDPVVKLLVTLTVGASVTTAEVYPGDWFTLDEIGLSGSLRFGCTGYNWFGSTEELLAIIGSWWEFIVLPSGTIGAADREAVSGFVEQSISTASTPRELVGDAELNEYINSSLQELYDLMVSKYGEDYFVAEPWAFTADGVSNFYPLPSNFSKLLGLDVQFQSGTPATWTRVEPFNMLERNRRTLPAVVGYPYAPSITNIRYRVSDNRLWIEPAPAAGTVFRLHYIPMMPKLADSGVVSVWDVSSLENPASSFSVNGEEYPGGDRNQEDNLSALRQQLASVATVASLVAGANNRCIGFRIEPKSPECIIEWSSSAPFIGVDPFGGEARVGIGFYPDGIWTGYTNARMSPWLEYVIVDCVIKCKQKEESDVGLEMAQKAALINRIELASKNRDAGGPKTVSDVRSSGWPWGYGNPGYGGW